MLDLETIRRDRAERMSYWRSKGVYADFTYADAFRNAVALGADTRLIFSSATRPKDTTVSELDAISERLASALHHLGLKRGDRLAVMLPSWADTTLAYLAGLKLGMAIVPIVAFYGARELGFICRQTRAAALIVPDRWRGYDYLERVAQAGPMPDLKRLIVVGDDVAPGAARWDDLLNHEGVDYPKPTDNADDVCLIIYTSGTTSDPKGVQHTHNTMLCDMNAARAEGVKPAISYDVAGLEGPTLTVFPAGHIAGFLALIRPFTQPVVDCVYVDHWDPEEGARLIEKYKVSSTAGTPIFLTTLMSAAEKIGADLSSLKRFSLGASAVTPDNIRWTDKLGFPGGRTYGMSEHTVVSTSTGDTFEKRANTDGTITARNQVRIVDDEGEDVPVGEVGEVATLGPRLFIGYVNEDLDKDAFLPGGWYKSGDIGRMDAEGYLTITDRKKDIIIRGGENISAKEVEDVIGELPGVVESCVTGMPDKEMGERICAYVVAPGHTITLQDVQAHFKRLGITRQKTPERVIQVEDFPRTPSGKVKKVDLRQQLRDEANSKNANI